MKDALGWVFAVLVVVAMALGVPAVAHSRRSAGEAVSVRSLESMDARQRLSTMAGAARSFFAQMSALPGEEVQL